MNMMGVAKWKYICITSSQQSNEKTYVTSSALQIGISNTHLWSEVRISKYSKKYSDKTKYEAIKSEVSNRNFSTDTQRLTFKTSFLIAGNKFGNIAQACRV